MLGSPTRGFASARSRKLNVVLMFPSGVPAVILERTATVTQHGTVASLSTTKAIGVASTKRVVCALLTWRGTRVMNTAKFNGIDVSFITARETGPADDTCCVFALATVPTGTTCLMEFTWSTTAGDEVDLEVWAVTRAYKPLTDTASAHIDSAAAAAATIDVARGGAILAIACLEDGNPVATWVGLTKQTDHDTNDQRHTTAILQDAPATQTNRAISVTNNAGSLFGKAMIAVSFR